MTSQVLSDKKPKIHFKFIDGLRGFAALWVVLHHAYKDGRISQFTNTLPQWFVDIVFQWGNLGVPIFFAISGFVIIHSIKNAKLDLPYFKNFTLRRLVRLNPPYYVSIVITLIIAFVSSYLKGEEFEVMGANVSFNRLIAHFFYAQNIFQLHSINKVYWTLCLEIQFYLVFCILFFLAQSLDSYWKNNCGKLIIFIPSAAIAALFPIGVLKHDDIPVTFLPLLYSFLLGIFAYWTWHSYLKPWLFYFYAAVLISAGIVHSSPFIIASPIVAILLLEVAKAQQMQNLLNWQWLQFLSKISYSLYLTHLPIIGSVYFFVYKLLGHSVWSEFLCLILAIVCCILFATLVWQLVEKPSIQWSKKLKTKQTIDEVAT